MPLECCKGIQKTYDSHHRHQSKNHFEPPLALQGCVGKPTHVSKADVSTTKSPEAVELLVCRLPALHLAYIGQVNFFTTSSSSSSSSSSLVYHPLRKGSRREMRTPSFISISQAVECCKGIQNFFFFFFFFFLLLLALCLSSLLAASVGSGLSIEVTIRWLAVTVRSTKNPIIFIFIIIIIFFFISMPHSLPT